MQYEDLGRSHFSHFSFQPPELCSPSPLPQRMIHMSIRMSDSGDVILPFLDLGFNQLAIYVDFSKTVKLSQVSSEQQLVSFR